MDRRRRNRQPRTIQDFVRAGVLRPVQPTTATGWTRYPGGREFLNAATNLVPDPQGVLADDTFWPADVANINTTANVDVPIPVPDALSGLTKCVSYVSDGTADDATTANLTVSASTSYRTSLYVYAPTVGGDITITAETGTSHTVATITAANSTWTRYSASTNTGVGQVTLSIKVAFAGAGASTIYITGAQVVAESIISPFFCGATGGCAWSSTANASTSTRPASSLQVTNANVLALLKNSGGTAFFRVTTGYSQADVSRVAKIHVAGGAGNRGISLYQVSASYKFAAGRTADDDTGENAYGPAGTFAVGTTHTVVARWDADTLDCMTDGSPGGQSTTAKVMGTVSLLYIGHYISGGPHYVSNFGIVGSRLSDADASAVHTMLSAGATGASMCRLLQDRGYRGDFCLWPLASDVVGYLG